MSEILNTRGEFYLAISGEDSLTTYMENSKKLEFSIPEIEIKRNDNSQVREKIMLIDPKKNERVEDKQVNVMVSAEKD